MSNNKSFFTRNGLSLTLLVLFMASFLGQIFAGWKEYNSERDDFRLGHVGLTTYLETGHFTQTTFENWESEFLQMSMYVILTIHLRQVGSSESKSLTNEEEVDREPDPSRPGAPWPVRQGGFVLTLYKNSLSIAFVSLFLASSTLHAAGSFKNYNEERFWHGKTEVSFSSFMGESRFWYESFQNWQSEFVAVISIVVLSIFLRQHGSPESKPVDASNEATGDG